MIIAWMLIPYSGGLQTMKGDCIPMKLRRILSSMMALLLVCGLPLAAFADTWYLEDGDITINASADESGSNTQTVTQGETSKEDSAPVITQTAGTTTENTVTITAEENATANVTVKDVNIFISDYGAPNDHGDQAAVITIDVADNATANVTLDGVNIDVSGTGHYNAGRCGEAAVQTRGDGDVTIELDGTNTVDSGVDRAGVEKNNGGNLTITDENGTDGSLTATGGVNGAGIGSGNYTGSSSNITITGSAEVTAQGGLGASGIGGSVGDSCSDITISGSAEVTAIGGKTGAGIGVGNAFPGSVGTVSNITVSGDAQVKVQGGEGIETYGIGAGAAIGNGGTYDNTSNPRIAIDGDEVEPNTDELTPNGKIEYYAPDANMETDNPAKVVTGTYVPPQPAQPEEEAPQLTEPVQPTQPEEETPQTVQPLYRVVGQDGKDLACKTEQSSGVLTITVDADFAALTGTLGGMKTLKAHGIDTIVFVTKDATSTFAVDDLLAQGASGDSYQLTHDGSTVTFTLGDGTDIRKILK